LRLRVRARRGSDGLQAKLAAGCNKHARCSGLHGF
jgi:hypothetical protein